MLIGVLVEFSTGAYVESTVWPGKEPRWDVYTAGGECVMGYADVNLAAHHADQLTGNMVDMGCWDGPSEVTSAPAFKFADFAISLWAAIVAHPAQVVAYEDFDL